jgi:hypothetical protein
VSVVCADDVAHESVADDIALVEVVKADAVDPRKNSLN